MNARARHWYRSAKARLIYRLDQYLAWPPLAQVAVVLASTVAIVAFWGTLFWSAGVSSEDPWWWAITHFADGGTMSSDAGHLRRWLAIGTTASGILVLSFLTGAFASKLGERLAELRSGLSPVVERGHILVLGFDAKVSWIARELALSHQSLTLVILAAEAKSRLEAAVKSWRRFPRSRLKPLCRTGDPRSEEALHRVAAEHARIIAIVPPSRLEDDRALRWTLSTLLAVRNAVGSKFRGRILVECRRSAHVDLLKLSGDAGHQGAGGPPVDYLASDDIVARLLAQSVRHGGVYFALRELFSFRGSELYIEAVPYDLVGRTFDEAHAAVEGAVVVGVLRGTTRQIAPPAGDPAPLGAADELIVLEPERGRYRLGGALPARQLATRLGGGPPAPSVVAVLGDNRTLPCLVTELDRVMPRGARLSLVSPRAGDTRPDVEEAIGRCANVTVEWVRRASPELARSDMSCPADAQAVVVLGCEDEDDPEGDASALAIMLRLRHARRAGTRKLDRLVTEVRDPTAADQVASTPDDFLVSTDAVAMLLAQMAVEPRLGPVHRELLDPEGAEVFVNERALYLGPGDATFREALAAARARGEIAVGWSNAEVILNPPRSAVIPDVPGVKIVVIAQP